MGMFSVDQFDGSVDLAGPLIVIYIQTGIG